MTTALRTSPSHSTDAPPPRVTAAATATAAAAAAAAEDDGPPSDSRRRILDTAARLFRADGYAATSLRDIADACGMKAGSLYYHFASKDAIVGEVLKTGVERVHHVVRDAVQALPADADPRTLLHTAVRAHLSALLELQDYTSANLRIVGQVPDDVRSAHIGTRDAYERLWSQLLKRCAKQGAFDDGRDLKLTRLFLIGALNGSLEWFRGGPVGVDRIATELVALFLDGLVERPPKKTKAAR